jgi:hypothetical protein
VVSRRRTTEFLDAVGSTCNSCLTMFRTGNAYKTYFVSTALPFRGYRREVNCTFWTILFSRRDSELCVGDFQVDQCSTKASNDSKHAWLSSSYWSYTIESDAIVFSRHTLVRKAQLTSSVSYQLQCLMCLGVQGRCE